MSYPNNPGFQATATSKQAANEIADVAPILRDRVLAYMKSKGAFGSTPDECAKQLGETVLAIRPRFTELKHMGMIRETKLTEKNDSGRAATVYVHHSLYEEANA